MLKRFGGINYMETNYEVIYLGSGEVDYIKEEEEKLENE